jgi:hypothetical protein
MSCQDDAAIEEKNRRSMFTPTAAKKYTDISQVGILKHRSDIPIVVKAFG